MDSPGVGQTVDGVWEAFIQVRTLAASFLLAVARSFFLLGIFFEVVEFDGAAFGAMSEVLTGADGLASTVFPVEVFVLCLFGVVADESGENGDAVGGRELRGRGTRDFGSGGEEIPEGP